MFRRSDSSTSIRSSSTDPPEIPVEDGTINSESYQLTDLDQKLGDWNIPKVPTYIYIVAINNLLFRRSCKYMLLFHETYYT